MFLLFQEGENDYDYYYCSLVAMTSITHSFTIYLSIYLSIYLKREEDWEFASESRPKLACMRASNVFTRRAAGFDFCEAVAFVAFVVFVVVGFADGFFLPSLVVLMVSTMAVCRMRLRICVALSSSSVFASSSSSSSLTSSLDEEASDDDDSSDDDDLPSSSLLSLPNLFTQRVVFFPRRF